MKINDKVVKVIFDAITDFNEQLDQKRQLKKSINTHIFGEKGKLESIEFVNLIVSVEQALEEEFGFVVTIADDRAMSQNKNPFESIGTLADYVNVLVEEKLNE